MNLDDVDIKELTELCLAKHGFASGVKANSLSAEHAPQVVAERGDVRIVAIAGVESIDALAPGQRLTFGDTGLTVVYGRNRSGKSGYVRILKQFCRARAVSPLRGNVFSEDNGDPRAVIEYTVDGGLGRADLGVEDPPPPLRSVSVYDSDCAAVLRSRDTKVIYRPFGLDLLEHLAHAADRLRDEIEKRIASLEREASDFSMVAGGTASAEFVAGLSVATTNEEIEQATQWADEDERHLNELKVSLSTDDARPAAAAVELQAQRLEALHERLRAVELILGPNATQEIRRLDRDALEASLAAQAAAGADLGHLDGVGGEVWRQLWESARRYSEREAYPGRAFPVVDEDAVCVLCEQPLEATASDRFVSLEEHVRRDVQSRADQAAASLERALRELDAVRLEERGDPPLWEEVAQLDAELAKSCHEYLAIQRQRRSEIRVACSDQSWDMVSDPPAALHTRVKTLGSDIKQRAASIRASEDLQRRDALRAELAELAARQALARLKNDLVRERDRRGELGRLRAALTDTATQGITLKSNQLTQRFVTDALIERFDEEAQAMGLEHVVLGSVGGTKGVLRHRVRLDGTTTSVTPDEIFSNGELNALGLAGYLTEIDESVTSLVLDDPVTSFDHDYRREMAYRLAQLALDRQVIVFSHDAVFAVWLCQAAEESGVKLTGREIQRGTAPGLCRDGLPWKVKPVKQRLNDLVGLLDRARRLHGEGSPEYEVVVHNFYKLLRTTWERAVEETLLGPILRRYSSEIHPIPVERLSGFGERDAQEFAEGYSRASAYGEMHDESPGADLPLPRPDQLADDLSRLREWNKRVKNLMSPRGGGKQAAAVP